MDRREFLITSAQAVAAAKLGAVARVNSRVGLVHSTHKKLPQPVPLEYPLDYQLVRDMVWKAIDYGRPSAGSLAAKIPPGSWVLIKPNLGFLSPQTGYRQYAPGDVTDMRVTKAVLEYVAHRSRARRITVAEGGSYRSARDPRTDHVVMQDGVRVDAYTFQWDANEFPGWQGSLGGMLDHFRAAFPGKIFDYINLGYDAVRDAGGKILRLEVPRTARGVGGFGERTDYAISRCVRECDFLISVPVLKVHLGTGITCCFKNYVSAAPREFYARPGQWSNGRLHEEHSLEGRLDSFVCDLASFHPPDYCVVDAIRGLQYDTHGLGRNDQTVRSNIVLAGEDPVAADALAAHLIGFNPWDLDYLHMAAQRDMGIFDLRRIDVVGGEPDRHRRTWAKPIIARWHGRCNREWLISADPAAPLASWKRHATRGDTLDFVKWGGIVPFAAYGAAVRVISEGHCRASLWVGLRGRLVARLNGEKVMEEENRTTYRIGQFCQPVKLRPGENLAVFQVEPIAGEARLSVLLTGPRNDGDTVDGIRWTT